VKFHSVYTGENYVPTLEVQENGDAPRSHTGSKVRIHQFTAAPILDATVSS
jgi:hypothetical protein